MARRPTVNPARRRVSYWREYAGNRVDAHPLTEIDRRRHRVGGYNEYAPPLDLADAVEALWTHETVGIRLVIHRVVPDAAVSLCFMGRRAPDGSAGASRLRLIGPVTTPKLFAPRPGHSMAEERTAIISPREGSHYTTAFRAMTSR